jgi:thiol-disulfide isomerase/thioredoxin
MMNVCWGTLLLLLSVGAARAEDQGFVGIHFAEQPEGLVVTKVQKGSGAALAGMAVGDLIVSIGGVELADGQEAPSIKGPLGTPVALGFRSALNDEVKVREVMRGERKAKTKTQTPKVISRFAGALRRDKPAGIRTATRALIDADFAGRPAADALGTHLARAAKRRRKAAKAALDELVKVQDPSPSLQYRVGEAYARMGDAESAARWLKRALAGWPRGLAEQLGRRAGIEEMAANAMWDAGDKQGAIDLTRKLSGYRAAPSLLAKVGMADPSPSTEWEIVLPPLTDFEVELIDGTPWTLSEHRGKPVVLVFWASWCGPCKKELPALAALMKRRGDWPVSILAISVDEKRAHKKAKTLVDGWNLPFPATITTDLSDRFGVAGLPSMRIVGPNGSLRSATKGYSKKSIYKLAAKLDNLVAEANSEGVAAAYPFGRAWGRGKVVVRHIAAYEDVRAIDGQGGTVTMVVRGHGAVQAPLEDAAVGGTLELEEGTESKGHTATAWFDGPVSAGDYWLRAHGADGAERWFVTMPSRIVSMTVSGDKLWVATKKGLVVLDGSGRLSQRIDISARDLAPDGAGGVWAVDGTERIRLGQDGAVISRDAAEGGAVIAKDGTWAGAGIVDLISGRFGPAGASRLVGVRAGGTIVGLDADGVAALRIGIDNKKVSSIAAADLDGDGVDELLISSWGRGIATVELEIP